MKNYLASKRVKELYGVCICILTVYHYLSHRFERFVPISVINNLIVESNMPVYHYLSHMFEILGSISMINKVWVESNQFNSFHAIIILISADDLCK